MPKGQIEHANLSVTDPQRSARLFEKLCGWEVRWEGPAMNEGYTVHVGNGDTYLALYSNKDIRGDHAKGLPLNHIGLLVDDLAGAESVVIDSGLVPVNHGTYEPGRRFYFFDWDGIEFEIVSYS